MMPKKSPVSYTILAHSKQHLYNKKGRPNREHRCGAGQIPSEGQVKISHNSRVDRRVDIFSLVQKSFSYRNPYERILWNPFLVGVFLSMECSIFPCIDMCGGQVLVVSKPSLSYTTFSSMLSFSHICPMLTPSTWSRRLHTVATCQWTQGRRVWLKRCSTSLYQ